VSFVLFVVDAYRHSSEPNSELPTRNDEEPKTRPVFHHIHGYIIRGNIVKDISPLRTGSYVILFNG
jgi:hypothetical protein